MGDILTGADREEHAAFVFTRSPDAQGISGTVTMLSGAGGVSVHVVHDAPRSPEWLVALAESEGIQLHNGQHSPPVFGSLADQTDSARLGALEWNLGGARNYALLVGLGLGASRILFLDDDIRIERGAVENLFAALDTLSLAGARILGQEDLSQVDRVAQAAGEVMDDCASGGCIAFRLGDVKYPFLNCYNEDLIWLRLHGPQSDQALVADVIQTGKCGPLDASEAAWQELGEVLLQGVTKAMHLGEPGLLLQRQHWETIVAVERDYLTGLSAVSATPNEIAVCSAAIAALAALDAEHLVATIEYCFDLAVAYGLSIPHQRHDIRTVACDG